MDFGNETYSVDLMFLILSYHLTPKLNPVPLASQNAPKPGCLSS